MNVLPARLHRLVVASAIGLVVAIIGALSIEQPPSAAIIRGDFPAFYTMATLAHKGEGAKLYDLQTQRAVQNAIWPSLQGSVLPVAYPAFLASCVEPLAILSPTHARTLWTVVMLLCVVGGCALVTRASPGLRGLTWQITVIALLFAPLFLGVLGGQIVGVSVLLYSALLYLDRRRDHWSETALGLVAGLWMYKPHFSCAVVAVFLLQQRWRAMSAWIATCAALWGLGVLVAGAQWLSSWYSFVRAFAQIDLVTNAPQMTGVVPFLYVVWGWIKPGGEVQSEMWEVATLVSILMIPAILAAVSHKAPSKSEGNLLACVGPLIVLFAPAVNFYDLALGAVPLILLFRPDRRADLIVAGGVIAMSQMAVFLKDIGIAGSCFALALVLAYLFIKARRRE